MLVRFPGLLFALCLAFGIWLRGCLDGLSAFAVATVTLCFGAVIFRVCRSRPQARPATPRSALHALTLAALGYLRASAPDGALRGTGNELQDGEAIAVRVQGVVDMPPVAARGIPGEEASPRTIFSIAPEDGSPSITVHCAGRPSIQGGDVVEAIGLIRIRKGPRNPGDIASRELRSLTVPDASGIRCLPKPTWPGTRILVGALREKITRTLEALYAEDLRGFIVAMVLGDRRLLASPIRDSLLLTGTFHLLAISGMHVTLLMFALYRLPLPRRVGGPIRLLILLIFTLVTGMSPPVLRAAVMFLLHAAAERRRRRARPLNTLGWSAVVLLGLQPTLTGDVGFQLSFISVAAILTWGERMGSMARQLPGPVRPWAASFLVSLGASVGTAPLTLHYFQRIHPTGPIWNLLAFPLTVVPLAGGILSLLLGLADPSLGAPIAWAVDRGTRILLLALKLGALLPGSTVFLPPPPAWTVVLSYALLTLWLVFRLSRAVFSTLCALSLGCIFLLVPPGGAPEIWTFDAGAGDASLLRASGAGSILIDAGMSGLPDEAGMALTRAVLAAGSRSIDLTFLTHAHADHTRGLQGVASRLRMGRVYTQPEPDRLDGRAQLLGSTARGGPVVEQAKRGLKLSFEGGSGSRGLEIEVLFPPGETAKVSLGAINDTSLALSVTHGGDRFLFLGDLEEDGIAALLCAESELEAQTLLAPHHGRKNKLWPALLERVRPRNVIISGRGDGGAKELAQELERSGVRVFATWRRGAVRTTWREGSGWVPEYWRK